MTYFLPAGVIKETLNDIYQRVTELKSHLNSLNLPETKKAAEGIEELALDLLVFIERFPCEPLIFTGPGNTEEVVKHLERALAVLEKYDQAKWADNDSQKKNA